MPVIYRLSILPIVFMIVLNAGCAESGWVRSNNIIAANFQNMHAVAIDNYEQDPTAIENDKKYGARYADWRFFLCNSYLELAKYSEFESCAKKVENAVREDNDPYKFYAGFYASIWRDYANMNLVFGDYEQALKNANYALTLLHTRTFDDVDWCKRCASGCTKCAMMDSTKDLRDTIHLETLKLKAVALALLERRKEALAVIDTMKPLLSTDASDIAQRKKYDYISSVYIALGDYRAARDTLNQYQGTGLRDLSSDTKRSLFTTGIVYALTGGLGALYTLGLSAHEILTYEDLVFDFRNAKVNFESGDLATAKKQYDKLLAYNGSGYWAEFDEFGNIFYVALHDRGRISLAEGNRDDALKYFSNAISVIESQRSTINNEASKIGFVGDKQMIYTDIVGLLVDMGKIDQAFEYVERGKSRALVDMLASRQSLNIAHNEGSTGIAANSDILKAEAELSSFDHRDSKKRAASRALIRKRQQDIQQTQPELASLVTVSAPSIVDLQKRLPANETLIEYYGDDKQLYAFVMSRSGVGAVKLDGRNIHQLISQFRGQINQPKSSAYKQTGQQLYSRLVAPVARQLNTSNLTIVPHGALHYLPFSALPTPRGHLIDQYSMRVLPSASVMQYLNKQHNARGTLLALGNPDLNDKSLDLPGAQQEAIAISKRLSGAQLLLRDRATETAVKQYGGAYKYLHFASHGVFDPEKPLQSGLLLSKDAANDGNLTVGELYDLNLNADLVTLSACETALGKVANGDDVVGFTRGFLYAGARSIVSSLWKVDDAATNQLMQSFYVNMNRQDKRSALRTAQLSVKEKYQHPYYWAAFQMTGAVN